MHWCKSHRFARRAVPLADRHYSRKTPGTPQFVPPGRCLVLLTEQADALWVTSWPYAKFATNIWPGAWVCSLFRNESNVLSSLLIREAVAATRFYWPAIPDAGLITFINPNKIRRKRDPGRCFLRAGFVPADPPITQSGHIVLQLLPTQMPDPAPAIGAQYVLDFV